MIKKAVNNVSFATFLRKQHLRIDRVLNRYLAAIRGPQNLHAAMRYAVGGKRLRPLLVYAVGEMYGADLKVLDVPAVAIEMIHSFSLVHDDLPAMDDDNIRRGKLTCHRAFDEATAILAGDALALYAFQIISESRFLTPQQAVLMGWVLAQAAGPSGMVGGQDIDIQFTEKKLSAKKMEQMYWLKTGALLSAAVRLGALAAGMSDQQELNKLNTIAKSVGLAFQIQDDILNIESSVAKLGKNVGTDKKRRKTTYPALVGVMAAKAKVEKLWRRVNVGLRSLKADSLVLRNLLEYIKRREY